MVHKLWRIFFSDSIRFVNYGIFTKVSGIKKTYIFLIVLLRGDTLFLWPTDSLSTLFFISLVVSSKVNIQISLQLSNMKEIKEMPINTQIVSRSLPLTFKKCQNIMFNDKCQVNQAETSHSIFLLSWLLHHIMLQVCLHQHCHRSLCFVSPTTKQKKSEIVTFPNMRMFSRMNFNNTSQLKGL